MASQHFSRLLLIMASVALFSGCASPSTTSTNSAPTASPAASTAAKNLKEVRVQLAFLMQSIDAPLIVAINKGYFAEQGLNVSYERGFGNSDTISKLGTGKFDLAFSDMYNALDFNEKNPGDKIIAVAITQNAAPFSILSLKEKGINAPKDLTGKKLGAPAGDGPRKLFPLFAKEVGIDPSSVQWTTMEPKLRETFLLQGQVDAISGFSTSALPALLKGGKKMEDINIFYYNENGLDFYGNAILVKDAYAKQNPDVVKAFTAAYIKGLQDVLKDPNAALDAVLAADQSKLMNREAEKIRLQVALDRLFITPEAEKLGLGSVDTKRLEKSIEQTVIGFNLKGKPKVADIYTEAFLPAKDQRAVPAKNDRKPLT
ncbi:MAG: ABC transporter substrate-binding protein [Lyngbya sp. HA4199-MV5]|jgi:NitT/TauT family transport system substrate-binding protein|nr:ABC transporter substrate-binding protein [Lyngbya sp. HA4199-MV5]